MGYSCTLQAHNTSSIVSSLSNHHPVYCRGRDSCYYPFESHAWVCDGIYNYSTETRYVLFTLEFQNGSPVGFVQNESYSEYYYPPTMFHINWGHGGHFNGFYLDSNMRYIDTGGYQHNYSSWDRQELLLHP